MKKLLLSIAVFAGFSASAQWTAGGTQYSTSALDNWHADIATDNAGRTYITWLEDLNYGKVYLQGFDADGNVLPGSWTPGGIQISLPDGDYWTTNVIMSSDNMPIVCWYGFSTTVGPTDRRHVFVQKFSNAGDPQWNGGVPIQVSPDSAAHAMNPVITSDLNGGCVISWIETDLSFTPSSNDLFIQRITEFGTVHSGWPGYPVTLANKAGVNENYPHLVMSADGNHIYAEYSEGSVSVSLHMQMIDPLNGTFQSGLVLNSPLLITPGTNIYQNAGREPFLFSTAASEAVILWVEFRTVGEIYVQRVQTDGTIALTASGVKLYDLVGDDLTYFHCFQRSDDEFFYTIRENTGLSDIVHVNGTDADGNESWGSDYVTTGGNESYSKLCTDGSDGMYLFFNESFGTFKVDHLLSDGTADPVWSGAKTIGDIGNFDGTKPHFDYNVVEGLAGKAYMSWNRKGSDDLFDVFACNLGPLGEVCTNVSFDGIDENELSKSVYPNPVIDQITIEGYNGAFTLVDAVGNQIVSGNTIDELNQQITDLPKGIYILQLDDQSKSNLRFIKG